MCKVRLVGGNRTKEIERKLISELMKNSRRSDRELAKAIGVSQPTANRMIRKLEQEGYVKEYTMIPDFYKLGYRLMALTFVKLKQEIKDSDASLIRRETLESLNANPVEIIMAERGMGLGANGAVISFHEDYSAYLEFLKNLKQTMDLQLETESFLVNLTEEIRYLPFTFSSLAKYLATQKKEKK
jgi:DNA-binding Lrp family transcriptional regulator